MEEEIFCENEVGKSESNTIPLQDFNLTVEFSIDEVIYDK